jgi:hypothetical protein
MQFCRSCRADSKYIYFVGVWSNIQYDNLLHTHEFCGFTVTYMPQMCDR